MKFYILYYCLVAVRIRCRQETNFLEVFVAKLSSLCSFKFLCFLEVFEQMIMTTSFKINLFIILSLTFNANYGKFIRKKWIVNVLCCKLTNFVSSDLFHFFKTCLLKVLTDSMVIMIRLATYCFSSIAFISASISLVKSFPSKNFLNFSESFEVTKVIWSS